jgi:hypothetical protein
MATVVEPYFLRFRFRLLKSYGSGSGFGSYFYQVLVPVPVPYVTIKSSFENKYLKKILPFYSLSFFTRKKLISFIKFIVNVSRLCVCENYCDTILLRFRNIN